MADNQENLRAPELEAAVIRVGVKFSIRIAAMRLLRKSTVGITLAAMWLGSAFAQSDPDITEGPQSSLQPAAEKIRSNSNHWLTADERLSLLGAAIDTRLRQDAEPDCSHLVHAIYQAAGFPYSYAPSSDIYAGIENFQRIKVPLPGDLVVWRGHVGIVIEPSQHIFFSYLSSGPGTDDYEAAYWKQRGRPRFYRYIKKN